MRIIFCTVGKNHEPYVKPGVDDFTKRLGNYFSTEWEYIAPLKNAGHLSPQELKKKEAALILDKVQKEDYLVLLDERGKQFSSEGLSRFLQDRANSGTRRIVFLIGGAFGVDEPVMQRANHTWSLSMLVFPHQLVRLILAEQVYRACTILKNEKYHHQ